MTELSEIFDKIAAPLDPAQIKVKKTTYTDKKTGEVKSFSTRYIDRTDVEERLNSVCPGEWSFQITPVVVPSGSSGQWVVKGTLTIRGVVREDLGMNDNEESFDPPKAAASDALKRCATLFGFARELYRDAPKKAEAPAAKPKPAAQAAPKTEKPAAGNGSGEGETVAIPGNTALCDLTGEQLYAVQKGGPAKLNLNPKHFENRWKKRFGVRALKDIKATVAEFMNIMKKEDDEPPKAASTLDEAFPREEKAA